MIRFGRSVLLVTALVSTAQIALAQGGGGRSDTAVVRSSKTDANNYKSAPRADKTHRKMPAPAIRKPEPARLAITVNEGGSTVDLDRVGVEGPSELISVASRSSSLIVRMLPAGTYTVSAKKPGFHDIARTIDLAEGKRRRVNIVLRPKMAILSVAANPADAKIVIDRLGEFDRPVKKHFVTPGNYRVTVSRRGYETRTAVVNLKRAGQEENLNVVLQPLRIDAVLALAEERTRSGRFDEAAVLIDDVLLLNDSHARANLLRGTVELKRRSEKAVDYLLKAIDRGETLRLNLELTEADARTSVSVALDRDSLSIESKERFDLNYGIPRANIGTLDHSADASFITITGTADFHGRPIEPSIRLSDAADENPDCGEPSTSAGCLPEIEIFYRILKAWRELPNRTK